MCGCFLGAWMFLFHDFSGQVLGLHLVAPSMTCNFLSPMVQLSFPIPVCFDEILVLFVEMLSPRILPCMRF